MTDEQQKIHRGYVRTDRGDYYVQISDHNARWGFYLCSDGQSWDGGIGLADSWEAVSETDVPQSVKNELGWILENEENEENE